MGIAADILGLRNHHFSSVAELLSALEQVCDAPVDKISARVFLAGAAADLVLTNVARDMKFQGGECLSRQLIEIDYNCLACRFFIFSCFVRTAAALILAR